MISSFFLLVFIIYFFNISKSDNSLELPKEHYLCQFTPLNILSLSPNTMDFTLEFELDLEWDATQDCNDIGCEKNNGLKVPHKFSKTMFIPAILFQNCKASDNVLFTNELNYYLDNENIWGSIRRTVTFNCHLDMTKYPFDTQNCSIEITSVDDIIFSVEEDISTVHKPSDYLIKNISLKNCTKKSKRRTYRSCARIDFILQRHAGKQLFLTYMPSALIVSISWISFWLDVHPAAPRITLGLTSMLTLMTHFNGAQRDFATVTHLMALDVWMVFCVILVFASILEYAVTYYKHRKSQQVSQPRAIGPNENVKDSEKDKYLCFKTIATMLQKRRERFDEPTYLDEVCRYFFPLFFIFFVVAYFSYYNM